MSEKILQLNEEGIKRQIKELVRRSVAETQSNLLEAEAKNCPKRPGTSAARHARGTAAVRAGGISLPEM